MLEFQGISFFDKTIKAWACRGAFNLYMILYNDMTKDYYVLVRPYDTSEFEIFQLTYKTQARAVKAAPVHAKRTA